MKLGDYKSICSNAVLNICPLIDSQFGLFTLCSSRGIKIGNAYLFEIASLFVYITSIVMTMIILYSIKYKIAAVNGKKIINLFFYLYLAYNVVELFTITNIIPMGTYSYTFFVGIHFAISITIPWSLLLFSISSYYDYFPILLRYKKSQLDDQESISIMNWSTRLSSLGVFLSGLIIALTTFNSKAGLERENPVVMYVFQYIISPVLLALFLVIRIVYLWYHIDSYWPIGDLVISLIFFLSSQMSLYLFNNSICANSKHYLDGAFFYSLLLLLSVMMFYKSWDSSNKDDLEFVIGENQTQLTKTSIHSYSSQQNPFVTLFDEEVVDLENENKD
ncbi:hypothetical protein K502DRAFT_320406 [Neoconidiobolus thromboides FSU 785]|nr:hypothetical protein K502DRAFT_320406 [Neoconidiobolus thromboides FSU 785]